MWQKCPICNGTGIDLGKNPNNEENKDSCKVCKGGLIINENGNPPKEYLKHIQLERAIATAEAIIAFYKNNLKK